MLPQGPFLHVFDRVCAGSAPLGRSAVPAPTLAPSLTAGSGRPAARPLPLALPLAPGAPLPLAPDLGLPLPSAMAWGADAPGWARQFPIAGAGSGGSAGAALAVERHPKTQNHPKTINPPSPNHRPKIKVAVAPHPPPHTHSKIKVAVAPHPPPPPGRGGWGGVERRALQAAPRRCRLRCGP